MMRYALLLFALLLPMQASATSVSNVRIDVNTTPDLSLSFKFVLSDPVNRDKSADADQRVPWRLADSTGTVLYRDDRVGFSLDAIVFKVESPNRALLTEMVNGSQPVHLEMDKGVDAVLANGKTYTLTPQIAEGISREMGPTNKRQRELVAAHQLGTYLLSEDLFDVAREVDQADTTRAEYVTRFRFLRPLVDGSRILWRAEGRIGTESGNPLNYAAFALTGRSNVVGGRAASARGFAEVSFLGDQRFRTTTCNATAGVEAVIPNLLDLTGRSGRIRPKPVVTLGGGYAIRPQDQALFPSHRRSAEFSLALDYYVPVANKFAISYSGAARYSDNINLDKKVRSVSSFSLSYDLPLEDLKGLVTWETGRHPLASEDARRLLIGILLERTPF